MLTQDNLEILKIYMFNKSDDFINQEFPCVYGCGKTIVFNLIQHHAIKIARYLLAPFDCQNSQNNQNNQNNIKCKNN